jgi:phosphoribosyl 1,2-cyclic phosphodiesterase
MQNGFELQVKFWGVRGSIPTPTPENLGYGGNTTCLEIRSPGGILIIDAGTGVRNLGLSLQQEFGNSPCSLALLLTHFHWDHIQGLPFFLPLYSPANDVTFRACRTPEQIQDFLEGQMSTPYFPVNFELLSAKRKFVGQATELFRYNGLEVHAFPLHHPQGATGYRIEHGDAVIVHASDFEHGDARKDQMLRDHAQSADVLIMDAQYTPAQYESKRGWGHSTWLEATRVARECGVKQLVLFHHDPSHSDEMMDQIVKCAQREFENTVAAKEGEVCGV